MKKLNLLIALTAIVIGFSSCTKEDNFSIIGTWTQEKTEFTIDFGIPGLQPITNVDTDPITVTFNGDGTGSATYDDEGTEVTDQFTWELDDDVLTMITPEVTFSLNLTTKTDTKIVGKQSLTLEEFVDFAGLSPEEVEEYEGFNSISFDMIITMVK